MPKLAQDLLITFGAAVKRARSLKGWELNDVANRIAQIEKGTPGAKANPPGRSFLSDIEKGKRSIGPPTVGRLIKALELDEVWIDRFLSAETVADADETLADRQTESLLYLADQDPSAPRTGEDLLIALAQDFAHGSHGDLQSAYNGLRAALDAAASIQRRGAMPYNLDDQIPATLAEVARLTQDNQRPAAKALLDRELARLGDEVVQRNQARATLLQSGVDVARTLNDPQAAAEYEQTRLALDAPADRFEAMCALFIEWYVRGRDQGLAFDATVAIHLAEHVLTLAQTADQRGAAQNGLGMALRTLGEREPGTARLEAAVEAYIEALKELARERVPLDWAATQNNLGNALRTLGVRESGTVRLEAAVAAYTEALKELAQGSMPLLWAGTQNNLGTALHALGQRELGTARLEAAVAAYSEALKERTQLSVPLDWAMTQNNLGNALRTIGEREKGTVRLNAAVAAYTEALKEWTRYRVPLDWAATQNNLGNALATLGEREPGTARLEAAVAAYTEALKERTRDRVPLDWAATQGNLANVEIAYFDKTAYPAHLARARTYALAARAVFVDAGAGHYVGMADEQLAKITAREA